MINAELALLGCLFLGDCENEIMGALGARPEQYFTFSEESRKAMAWASEQWRQFGKVDAVCAVQQFGQFASECIEFLPSLSSWPMYVKAIKDKATEEKVRGYALQLAMEGTGKEQMQQIIDRMAQTVNSVEDAESVDMAQMVAAFREEQQTEARYIPTGYGKLDTYVQIEAGDFAVIGGRPSAGKTAFSLAVTLGMAKAGYRVAYFSLETSLNKLGNRIMAAHCGLKLYDIKRRALGSEWERQEHLAEDLENLPIELIKASGRSVAWIQSEAIRRKADVAVIDYIGLIQSEGNSRYEKMTSISMGLHNFAQQCGIAVIGLAQLNRQGAEREPTMEDIRESGQVEQDCDAIILLHNEGTEQVPALSAIIAKNKEGRTGKIALHFNYETQQIMEVETRHEW